MAQMRQLRDKMQGEHAESFEALQDQARIMHGLNDPSLVDQTSERVDRQKNMQTIVKALELKKAAGLDNVDFVKRVQAIMQGKE